MFMGRKKEEVKGINWNDTERINDKKEKKKNTLEESTETRFLKEKYQQQIDLLKQ